MRQVALPCLLFATAGTIGGGGGEEFQDSKGEIQNQSSKGEAPPAAGGVCQLRLGGGTDAAMAPPVGYAQHVLLPLLRRHLRASITLDVRRRGFYPKVRGLHPSIIPYTLHPSHIPYTVARRQSHNTE